VRLPTGLRRPSSAAAAAYARAALPGGGTGWRAARWAVVDLDLTGLDPRADEIVAVGVVPVDGGRIRAGDALYRVVRPHRPPSRESVEVHGITPAELEAAPPLEDVVDDLFAALAGRRLVAHAAFVERAFLTPVLRARGVRIRGGILDTQLLARAWIAERTGARAERPELGELAAQLGLPAHRAHHALGDALTTAQVFLALATHLERGGVLTVRALRGAQERARGRRRARRRRSARARRGPAGP
jgi:DNA polymerase-3 subunit epsilon